MHDAERGALAMPVQPVQPVLYDHALIRVVPRVEREEFVNVGAILSCPSLGFLAAQLAPDWTLIEAMAPGQLDHEVLQQHLQAIVRICQGDPQAGPIARIRPRERFHFLTARRSTVIQTSPVHTGRTRDPARCLDDLVGRLVRRPARR